MYLQKNTELSINLHKKQWKYQKNYYKENTQSLRYNTDGDV
jgi:hypothetical protein